MTSQHGSNVMCSTSRLLPFSQAAIFEAFSKAHKLAT
jgi:hypothetical protein